jgi:hypothetical protein
MSKSLTRILIMVLLAPYSLLLVEFIATEITLKNILKALAAVFGPIPLVLFTAFIFTNKTEAPVKEINLSILSAFSYLLATLFLTILGLDWFESFIYPTFSTTVVPIFFNSFILAMYIINLLFTKDMKMIAILSGISIGISMYVLFLT